MSRAPLLVLLAVLGCGGEMGAQDASAGDAAGADATTGADATLADASSDAGAGSTYVPCGPSCPATVLVTVPSPGISSFAIDATDVYWTVPWQTNQPLNGLVQKCPLTGCATPVTLATHQDYATGIYVTGSTLYWSNYNAETIATCSVDCTDDATLFQKWPAIQAGVALVRSGASMLVTTGIFGGAGQGRILSCGTNDCADAGTFASNQAGPVALAADATEVYWLDYGNAVMVVPKVVDYVDASVVECEAVGCNGTGTVLAANRSRPTGLAIDGANVYWAEGGVLYACAKGGCGQQPKALLSFPNGYIEAVAVDDSDVYFVLADNLSSTPAWRVVKAPLDGSSTPVAITSTQFGNLMEIALDATHVYWVRGGTQIVATPK